MLSFSKIHIILVLDRLRRTVTCLVLVIEALIFRKFNNRFLDTCTHR